LFATIKKYCPVVIKQNAPLLPKARTGLCH
jgi:hypothetical protein